ncbi:MAG: TonB-dependent receptor [Acidobacteria bacterium]|nr:TonB-dependent receptor [Acidobacteriota bacterium]
MVKRLLQLSILLSSLFVCSHSLFAQETTATLSGVVQDDSGAVLPGVSVAVRNLETGRTREVITGDEGRYRLPNLALGSYEVQAVLSGFQTAVRSGITLTVGREAVVNFTLKVGEITEKVTVTGEAPLVETTKSELADLVDEKKIRDLPLNGRSYTQLALLQPGVMAAAGGSTAFNALTGGGVKLSIGGARPMNTMFYLDGTDVRDAFGRTPGSAGGQNLGVDTIREFTVLINTFSAEFGGSGGVINSVTKSGTNELHGSVFEFLRNSALDAKNFFDRGANAPPFKRNQFGFTLGGPIKKDKTFFFGSYEGLRERLSTTNIIGVPDADSRAGILPSGPPVMIHPLIKKYLDAMPLPNGRLFNDGTGEFLGTRSFPVDENYFMVKVDHQLGASDTFSVRYTFDDASRESPQSFPQFSVVGKTRFQYLTIEETKIMSAALLNTFRFAFNRSSGGTENQAEGVDPALNLIPLPDRLAPQTNVPSLSQFGTNFIGDRASILNTFQFVDKLNYTVGRHSVRTGVDISRFQQNGFSAFLKHGQVRFATYRDFLEGKILAWQFLVPGTGTIRGFRQSDFALYVADDIRITPKFTLNLGLRWEFVTSPTEVAGRVANIRDVFHDTQVTIGDPFIKLPKDNFGPRVGLAWDLFGNGKTAVRAGWGIFHQQFTSVLWNVSIMQMPPFQTRAQFVGPALPPPYASTDPSSANPSPTEFAPKTPDMMQYNLTLQQELSTNTVLGISYVGSRGVHLTAIQNFNIAKFQVLADGRKFWPAGAQRINPAFASYELRTFGANSSYNSLQLRLNRRFSKGLQLQGSYTFSRNIDNTSETQITAAGFMDPYDSGRDRGLSDYDVRHNFTFNYTYDLPLGSNLAGVGGVLLRGWQMNGLLNVQSGVPINIAESFNRSRNLNLVAFSGNFERPDLKPGAENNPVLGGPDRYLDPGPFQVQEIGTLGNLGRNTAIGPGSATFDFSLIKNFDLNESRHVQFRAEFFNLFNRANFGQPNAFVFTDPSGAPSGNFGRITSTITTSRQIQFALKLIF